VIVAGEDSGAGTQTFTYDALNRITAASGLAQSRAWTYDLNGNRKTAVTDSSTDTFTYDRTVQLLTVKRDAGSNVGHGSFLRVVMAQEACGADRQQYTKQYT
jgi:hypothetical protein